MTSLVRLSPSCRRPSTPSSARHMVALYTVWYNFVKLHKAHKLTPAMAADVTDKLWSVEDIVALVEASEPKPGKRGPYKKRAA
jgi:hypothetical protein